MAIHITDPETDKAVRDLAALWGVSLTEAIRRAAQGQLHAHNRRRAIGRAVTEIQAEAGRYAPTGLKADKAFFDSLNNE